MVYTKIFQRYKGYSICQEAQAQRLVVAVTKIVPIKSWWILFLFIKIIRIKYIKE